MCFSIYLQTFTLLNVKSCINMCFCSCVVSPIYSPIIPLLIGLDTRLYSNTISTKCIRSSFVKENICFYRRFIFTTHFVCAIRFFSTYLSRHHLSFIIAFNTISLFVRLLQSCWIAKYSALLAVDGASGELLLVISTGR